jgi:hypothetical protein
VRVVKTVGSHGPGPAQLREKGADLRIGTSGQGPGPLGMLSTIRTTSNTPAELVPFLASNNFYTILRPLLLRVRPTASEVGIVQVYKSVIIKISRIANFHHTPCCVLKLIVTRF